MKSREPYIFLAAGVIMAAFFYSVFLEAKYQNIDVIYTLGILELAMVYLLFRGKTMEARFTMLAVIVAAIIYFGFNVGGFKEKVDTASKRASFSGFTIIADREYATIRFTMAKKDDAYYIFENGLVSYKIPDEKYAKLAYMYEGGKILVINGGLAGMVEELTKLKAIKEIVSVETDPFTAFIMEKTFKPSEVKGVDVKYLSIGGFEPAGKDFTTVFLNYRELSSGSYDAKYFAKIKAMLKTGGMLVISHPEGRGTGIAAALKSDFTAIVELPGVITARAK